LSDFKRFISESSGIPIDEVQLELPNKPKKRRTRKSQADIVRERKEGLRLVRRDES